jgi:hypothetical protein
MEAEVPRPIVGRCSEAKRLFSFFAGINDMTDPWLKSLLTATPQEGFELAITLSRRGVKYTQSDPAVLQKLRPEYANSAEGLTAASQVVAINFQTVAAANDYWRK